jgi:hypothetical protein
MRKWKPILIAALLVAAAGAKGHSTPANQPLTAADYIEIQQLVAQYPFALDAQGGDGTKYADLYTPDGSFRDIKGRAALIELAAGNQKDRTGPAFTHHFVTNLVIKPSPEGATGRQYMVALDIDPDGKQPAKIAHGGHYDDVYVKTPAGWRIKSRNYIRSELGPRPAAQ